MNHLFEKLGMENVPVGLEKAYVIWEPFPIERDMDIDELDNYLDENDAEIVKVEFYDDVVEVTIR